MFAIFIFYMQNARMQYYPSFLQTKNNLSHFADGFSNIASTRAVISS